MTMPLCTDCITFDSETETVTINGFPETGEYGYIISFSFTADTVNAIGSTWNSPSSSKESTVLATRSYLYQIYFGCVSIEITPPADLPTVYYIDTIVTLDFSNISTTPTDCQYAAIDSVELIVDPAFEDKLGMSIDTSG